LSLKAFNLDGMSERLEECHADFDRSNWQGDDPTIYTIKIQLRRRAEVKQPGHDFNVGPAS
jgi:hypothetical protein